MKYMGSKSRIAKHIVPIIQNYINENNIEKYVEPFVGGANMICNIRHRNNNFFFTFVAFIKFIIVFTLSSVHDLTSPSAAYLDIRIIRVIHRIFLSSSFAPNCINPAFPC